MSQTNLIEEIENQYNIVFEQKRNGLIEDNYDFLKTIQEGKNSIIYKAMNKNSEKICAIKKIRKDELYANSNKLKHFINEIYMMTLCNHPNIIKIEELYEEETSIFIVMKLFQTDLYNLVERSKHLTEIKALQIFQDILQAVEYFEQFDIIHNDLKLENIFLHKDQKENRYIPIIGDFGIAYFTNQLESFSKNSLEGTPGYFAPEILNTDGYKPYSFQSDIFSLGCILYIMIFGKMPYKGNSSHDILESNKNDNPYFQIFSSKKYQISDDTKELIILMLEKNPLKRISLKSVLAHSAFNIINYPRRKQNTLKIKVQHLSQSLSQSQSTILSPRRKFSQIKITNKPQCQSSITLNKINLLNQQSTNYSSMQSCTNLNTTKKWSIKSTKVNQNRVLEMIPSTKKQSLIILRSKMNQQTQAKKSLITLPFIKQNQQQLTIKDVMKNPKKYSYSPTQLNRDSNSKLTQGQKWKLLESNYSPDINYVRKSINNQFWN